MLDRVFLQNALNDKKYLIYMDENFSRKDFLDLFCKDKCDCLLTDDRSIFELYSIYDFSDRLVIMTDSKQYGSIWNYVDAGILTIEEAIDALLA